MRRPSQGRRTGLLVAAALACYALGLLLMAPATLVDRALARAGTGQLRVVEARGSLWSGHGLLELRDHQQRTRAALPLTWQLRPLRLLRGQLAADVRIGSSTPPFLVVAAPGQLAITDLLVELPAAALAVAEPRLAPLGLDGQLRLQSARLVRDSGGLTGTATVQWQGAASAYAPVAPLGDYSLQLSAEGETLRATLVTLQGPLQLDGSGSWTARGPAEFQGSARVPPPYQAQLAPLLRMIAVERGEGRYDLQLR